MGSSQKMWIRPDQFMSRFVNPEAERATGHEPVYVPTKDEDLPGIIAPRPSMWRVYRKFLSFNWDVLGIFYAKPDHSYNRPARIVVFLASLIVSVSLSAAFASNNTKCDSGQRCLRNCFKDWPNANYSNSFSLPPSPCSIVMAYNGAPPGIGDPRHYYKGDFFYYPYKRSTGFDSCVSEVESSVTNSDHSCLKYCKDPASDDVLDQRLPCTADANRSKPLGFLDDKTAAKGLLCVYSDTYSPCDHARPVARFFWQTVVAGVLLMFTVYIWRFMITYTEPPCRKGSLMDCCHTCSPSCVRSSGWVLLLVMVMVWIALIIAVYRDSLLNKRHVGSFFGQAITSLLFSYFLSYLLLTMSFFLAPKGMKWVSGYRKFMSFEDPLEAVDNDLRRIKRPLRLYTPPEASVYTLGAEDSAPLQQMQFKIQAYPEPPIPPPK